MKKIVCFITIITVFNNAFCQDISKKCLENAAIISTLIENKNFNNAEKIWYDLNKKCNNLNEKFYKNGETILENKKESANSINEKKATIQQLIQLYNQYNQKFPANQNQNGTKKALYLSFYNIGTNDEIFAALDRDFKNDNSNFKNPEALYLYFNSIINQYKSNKNNISIDDLITKNIEINQKIDVEIKIIEQNIADLITKQKTEPLSGLENTNLKKYNENLTAFNNTNQGIQSLISPYFTCENLVKFSIAQFETNQNNSFWIENISEKLFTNSCYTDPILEKIVQKSYEINPTSKAALHLGYIYLKKNNTEKTNILFNEAADKALDNNQKAEIYYTIATVVYGLNDKQKSFEYSNKALSIDPTLAKAFLYQTQLIESGIEECKTSDFEKKAINWLLSETVLKAGKANKIYEKSSQTKSDNYLKKAPTKTETKTAGYKEGDKITFNCWLNQSIEIPKF
jgi:tetratricopeptide (TPR) repeat protein